MYGVVKESTLYCRINVSHRNAVFGKTVLIFVTYLVRIFGPHIDSEVVEVLVGVGVGLPF